MRAALRVRSEAVCDAAIFAGVAFVVFFLPIYNSLTSFGLGLAIFFFLLRFILSPTRSSMIPKAPGLYLFLLCCLASVLFSSWRSSGAIGLRKLALHLFFFFCVIHTARNVRRGYFLIVLFLLTGLTVSLDGLYQAATGSDLFVSRPLVVNPGLGIRRITASFLQSGALGIYLGVVAPIALSLTLFFLKGNGRIAGSLGTLLIIVTLILTLAPGAALGFMGMLFFICSMKKIRWPVLAAVVLAIALWIFLPGSLTSFPEGRIFRSFFERAQLWRVSLSLIGQHPLIGGGLNTFGPRYAQIVTEGYPYYHLGTPYAHNTYIQLMAETGLFGFCSFIFFVGHLLCSNLASCIRETDALKNSLLLGSLGSMIAYLIHAFLESSLQTSQGAILFWLLAGFMMSLTLHRPSQDGVNNN